MKHRLGEGPERMQPPRWEWWTMPAPGCWVVLMTVLALCLAGAFSCGASGADLPKGAVEYAPAQWTQSLFRLDERVTVRLVPVRALEAKWHQSGGMEGVAGVTSRKYKWLPEGKAVAHSLAPVLVGNSFGVKQAELGIVRTYPAGARFDDVLSYKGKVFEHRMREKQTDGSWQSSVLSRDPAAYPPGYTGLKVVCASCHDKAGSGEYGAGLVPGGDTVLSDPLDWTLLRREWKTEADIR